ncbi:MAG: hypothetical protein AB1553_11355 [Nitrospirota bacterium]
MNREHILTLFLIIVSLAAGAIAVRLLLRKAALAKNADNTYSLRIPFLGTLSFDPFPRCKGIVIDELLELTKNLDYLKQFLDIHFVLRYAREFKITYVGTEGDREDGSWSPGRLAYCEGGCNIYLNPHLDIHKVSLSLSWELKTIIAPSEVYPFLFLHEVGHTAHAGNQNFYTAVVNHALSGGRHSAKRRKELSKLKNTIERFADAFALKELERWREERAKNDPIP